MCVEGGGGGGLCLIGTSMSYRICDNGESCNWSHPAPVKTPPPADELFLKNMLGFWGSFFLSNKHREFSFKFYNKTLGLNTRLSHFVANNTRSCTFCVANNLANPPDESFLCTSFFYCNYTNNILCKMRDLFVPEITFRNTVHRTEMKLFWFSF